MNWVEVGDTGILNKDDSATTLIRRAQVIKTPSCDGDVWGFRNLDNGAEIFTNERFTFYRDATTPDARAREGDA